MKKLVIPFNDIPQLSSKDKAYSTGNQYLKPFYKHTVNIDSFQQVISDKSTQDIPRNLIIEVLKEHQDRINWANLSSNPGAIDFLKEHQAQI